MPRTLLTVLDDNRGREGLLNEWGWSLLVEPPDISPILFDADTSPRVIGENSRRLGVDLGAISLAAISHEHSDHYGGMEYVASVRPGVRVYVPPGLHLWAKGLDVKLVFNPSGVRLNKRYTLTPPLRASIGLYEHALVVDVGGGRSVVAVGCSHPGVERLAALAMEYTGLRPLLVIGGFHGPSRWQLDKLAGLADYIAPAHCSGDDAVEYVRRRYPDKLVLVRTGSRILVVGEEGRVEVLDY
ncbi:MAG: MBL fold metallo-hydrolase [Desulfurococcales archaeon]|nr:MBL fold metallo-hydrolase [Desulfurococcales archaeon]